MIYEFRCQKCNTLFEVVKSVKEFTLKATCTECGAPADLQVSSKIGFIGTKVESAEYNPGLGCVTKSKKHREELAKRKGLIEIGNDNPDNMHKANDKARAEKLKKSWEDI